MTVTDVLPKGVNYVEGSAENATYDAATRTLTWSLGEQAAGATGTLSFDVKVSAEAAVVDDISNTATVKVGENESQTTTTHNKVSCEGSLTVKKTVVGGDSPSSASRSRWPTGTASPSPAPSARASTP